jgi:hypothetical protein
MINYNDFPNQNLVPAIKRYVEERIKPGDFLYAVMTNNLKETFLRSDMDNIRILSNIVSWFYWEMPSTMWGSVEKVKKHLTGE